MRAWPLALVLLSACGGQTDGSHAPPSPASPDASDASAPPSDLDASTSPDSDGDSLDGAVPPGHCSGLNDPTPCPEGLVCVPPTVTIENVTAGLWLDWVCAPYGTRPIVPSSTCGAAGPVGPECGTNEVLPCCGATEAGCFCIGGADY